MVRKIIRMLLIVGSLFFSYGLISIGLPVGIPVIILIDIFVLLLTGKKDEVVPVIKKVGTWGQERTEIFGEVGKNAVEIASKMAVQGGKMLNAGVKAAYKEIGGTEGANKAVKDLSKFTEEALKIGGTAAIESLKVVANVTEDLAKRVNRKKEDPKKKKLLEDIIKYEILDDND